MTKTLQIMYIGNDPSLIGHVFAKLQQENVAFNICKDLQDASNKIEHELFDVYIFDHRSSQEVLSIIRNIRKNEKKPSVVAVVIKSLEELKIFESEAEKIDYVLEESVNFKDVDELLQKILPFKAARSEKLAALKKNYDESIHEKIALLRDLIKKTQKNPSVIKDLKIEIHKMAGSAGTYGYESVSDVCKSLENEMNARLENGSYRDPEWLSTFDEHLKKIELGFQITKEVLKPEESIVKPVVYVVDDDALFLDLLERVKEGFWIDLVVETSPESALKRVKEKGFNPKAVTVSEYFRASSITGLDIIKEAQKKWPSSQYSLILEKDSIDKRLEALNIGIQYTFSKPVSAFILLKTISDSISMKKEGGFKALIVDDDVDFCAYTAAILEEMGASVSELHEPTDLFKKLESYTPQLLLLDILLPKYDGLNLLKTIRHDVAYKDLIIVLVTGTDRVMTKIDAYAENVDDILFKPIDPQVLQKRLLNLLDRRRSFDEVKIDQSSGLHSYRELIQELESCLKRSDEHTPFLALFEVNKSDGDERSVSHKDLTVFISNQLQWEKNRNMHCFIVKENQFAIVFETGDLDLIEKNLTDFLYRVVQDKTKWNIYIKAAIVAISNNFENASQIMNAADEVLIESGKKEYAPVRIAHRLPKGVHAIKRHVMIIDPDENILKVLRQVFEVHGLFVSTYSEGGDALKALFSGGENMLPSLIIMERKLPDMEGMDLYIKLKNRFRTPIPLFMLTVFSSDKDMGDGIKYGVLEYIVKPFNISLLVQKALQVVFQQTSKR